MPNEPSGTLGSTLRPNKVGAWLSGGFISLLAISVGIGLGTAAALLSKMPSQAVISLVGVAGLASILNIVFSQVAAQTLLSVRIDSDYLITRTLLASHKAAANAVNAIYVAPNIRYTNIVIDTASGPQLLSDAIWTLQSFSVVHEDLCRWSKSENIKVIAVSTAWMKTEGDRHARRLLLRCFREPYFYTLGFLLSVAGVSFLVTTLI